jgi:hypothetical protein
MLLAVSTTGHAALSYTVQFNVASLIGNSNGPFSIDLQMTAGSGNASNSVTLSNFQVIGGSLIGPVSADGSYSGSLETIVPLNNTALKTYFAQQFSDETTAILFGVTQTTNSEFVAMGTAIPDQFSVYLDDPHTPDGYVPTTDPNGANTLLVSSIVSGQTYQNVATFGSTAPDAGISVNVVRTRFCSTADSRRRGPLDPSSPGLIRTRPIFNKPITVGSPVATAPRISFSIS